MGEGIIEAEVTRWLVNEGQPVNADEPIVEVATDKVDNEIPAPASGFLQKILVSEGETSKIGQVLAVISTDAVQPVHDDSPGVPPESSSETESIQATQATAAHGGGTGNAPDAGQESAAEHSLYLVKTALLSPVVRKMTRDHRIGPDEIESIEGTGMNGRITRRDIENYLHRRTTETRAVQPQEQAQTREPAKPYPDETAAGSGDPSTAQGQTHTRIVMDRMRQKIADHMVFSKHTAPHVTSFVESDLTAMMEWRERIRDDFEARSGQKLTVTTLIIEAVIKALKEFPGINVSVEDNTIIQKHELNIGMATALPDGNLIVPVIREADKLNLAGLATIVNDLAERARNNNLKPDEVKGGTFTVTNLGNFGNIAGTPIINQPEVAILAAGAIRKMPAVVATPHGDAIGIRQMMILSLAYDHRVVDGALGGSFLRSIGNHLQNFDDQRTV